MKFRVLRYESTAADLGVTTNKCNMAVATWSVTACRTRHGCWGFKTTYLLLQLCSNVALVQSLHNHALAHIPQLTLQYAHGFPHNTRRDCPPLKWTLIICVRPSMFHPQNRPSLNVTPLPDSAWIRSDRNNLTDSP
ncbi:hypothetical protein CBL_05701 [Carabus blaptoides fortunei]